MSASMLAGILVLIPSPGIYHIVIDSIEIRLFLQSQFYIIQKYTTAKRLVQFWILSFIRLTRVSTSLSLQSMVKSA
ncbi:MAG: hypothetical protein ACOX77_05965, partial [Caldicoprobacterales bacterium]